MKKEELKIIGQGSLHNKSFGNIKINDYESKIIYNNKLDQYCINGQWQIPFHTNKKTNIDYEIKDILFNIKKMKSDNIKEQKYEISALLREIEKNLIKLINLINKNKEKNVNSKSKQS